LKSNVALLNILMMSFRKFMEQGVTADMTFQQDRKPWKAKKADVLEFWKNIRPGQPIQAEPVQKGHSGTRFREDGVRVTGSPAFINSILSRIKDLLSYDANPGTKLDVEYREIENKSRNPDEKQTFVFYTHILVDQKEKEDKPKLEF
jgi:hypothetical protein